MRHYHFPEVTRLFSYRLVPNAAKGFFGDAQVGGNDVLRKTLQKFGVLFD